MHEIKFQGKRVDNGEWVVGFYVGDFCFEDEGRILSIDETGMGIEYEVDPATVGQYIRREDKNGVEIYEGDILGGIVGGGVVCWDKKSAGFAIDINGELNEVRIEELEQDDLEVIGNRWDNPELLEVKP